VAGAAILDLIEIDIIVFLLIIYLSAARCQHTFSAETSANCAGVAPELPLG
jgi:hypothetical protein